MAKKPKAIGKKPKDAFGKSKKPSKTSVSDAFGKAKKPKGNQMNATYDGM